MDLLQVKSVPAGVSSGFCQRAWYSWCFHLLGSLMTERALIDLKNQESKKSKLLCYSTELVLGCSRLFLESIHFSAFFPAIYIFFVHEILIFHIEILQCY